MLRDLFFDQTSKMADSVFKLLAIESINYGVCDRLGLHGAAKFGESADFTKESFCDSFAFSE